MTCLFKFSEKDLVDGDIDLDLALRAADTVTEFLDTCLEKPFERYIAVRLVCILYEAKWGCLLGPELEVKFREFAKQDTQS